MFVHDMAWMDNMHREKCNQAIEVDRIEGSDMVGDKDFRDLFAMVLLEVVFELVDDLDRRGE